MKRPKLTFLAVFVVSFGTFAASVRVVDRFKSRVDERVVRRHRLRELRELTDNVPPTASLQDLIGALAASNNATSSNHIHNEGGQPDVDYPEMVISESDLIEAAIGQHRTPIRRTVFEQNVIFRFYHGNTLKKTTTLGNAPLLSDSGCSPTEKFAIIAHGWHENCFETFWVKDLEENLNTYRGGCVICMDYSTFASNGYTYLFRRFNDISAVLYKFIRKLQYEGMQFENLFMFGFSFGGQLVLDSGNLVGLNAIEAIDTCDMAGVGFDSDRFFKGVNFRSAAKNVQCIHTSTDKGTKLMNKCHQDWRMGQCGFKQIAAGKPPLGSHGLCPVFYNLAFKSDFYAEARPAECSMLRDPTADYPNGFRMGYLEKRKGEVQGELYAQTSRYYPYTVFNF